MRFRRYKPLSPKASVACVSSKSLILRHVQAIPMSNVYQDIAKRQSAVTH